MSGIIRLCIDEPHSYVPLIPYRPSKTPKQKIRFLLDRPYAYAYLHGKALKKDESKPATKVANGVLMVLESIPLLNIPIAAIDHALHSYRENIYHMDNTIEFLSTMNCRFRHIRTNIISDNFSDILSRARVFLLGERHENQKHRESIGYLINNLWLRGSHTLTEGRPFKDEELAYSQMAHVKAAYQAFRSSWDIADFDHLDKIKELQLFLLDLVPEIHQFWIKSENCTSEAEKAAVIKHCNSIFALLLRIDRLANCPDGSVIEKFELEESHDLTLMRFAALKVMTLSWEHVNDKLLKRVLEFANITFCERNYSLADKAVERVQLGDSRVFIIAGKNHLIKRAHSDEGVDALYSTLRGDNIPYVTLFPRSKPHLSSAEEDDNQWKPKRHAIKRIDDQAVSKLMPAFKATDDITLATLFTTYLENLSANKWYTANLSAVEYIHTLFLRAKEELTLGPVPVFKES